MNAPETRENALQQTQATCRGCHGLFTPARRWQTFCKDSCRADFHRRTKADPKALADLKRQIADLKAGQHALAARVEKLEGLLNP